MENLEMLQKLIENNHGAISYFSLITLVSIYLATATLASFREGKEEKSDNKNQTLRGGGI